MLVVFLGLLAWVGDYADWQIGGPTPDSAHLISVTDGDTVHLDVGGYDETRFRFATIDAPERDQPFGRESTQCLRDLLRQGDVTATVSTIDRYGRLVGNVFLDGQRVDVELVKKGCAWWYSRYAPASIALMRAHYTAKRDGVGLWRDSEAIEPEAWRQGAR